ncbi:hypothetical protein MAR_024325 [Mya arenaria]|uniref:Uncharacterized protein n=1 Tax=Mya arenaria TaxID=6604 RepID=A0ABY7DQH6_MYAAR|nr:hypothetical protein MAR_024325 [Mya arenaria]
MLKLKIIFLFSWFLCYVCDFNSVDSAIYMPNEVKGGLSFRNCNSTPVPLTFEHVDIQPDPVQMDLGYVNLSMNATLTKMIGNSSKVDPNAVKGGLSFRNCNSTPVPLTFEHVDIQPDPVQMDLGYVNLSMNATLTKMIGNSSKVDFQVIAVYFEQT